MRNVRNFWVEVDIDGRKHTLKGGPQGKTGGLVIRLYQRADGDVQKVLHIDCLHVLDVDANGHLTLGVNQTMVNHFLPDVTNPIVVRSRR